MQTKQREGIDILKNTVFENISSISCSSTTDSDVVIDTSEHCTVVYMTDNSNNYIGGVQTVHRELVNAELDDIDSTECNDNINNQYMTCCNVQNWKTEESIVLSIAVSAVLCGATAGIGCAVAAGALAGGLTSGGFSLGSAIKSGKSIKDSAKATVSGAIKGAIIGGASAAAGYGIGKALGAAGGKIGQKLASRLGDTNTFGRSSKLFGSKAFSNESGLLNKNGAIAKLGWSKDSKYISFRIGLGRKSYYNVLRQKSIVTSRIHIDIFRYLK